MPADQHQELHWLETLRARCAATGQTAVAEQLGYSRTTVSLVLAGKYPGGTDRIAARVVELFGLEEPDAPVQTAEPGVRRTLPVWLWLWPVAIWAAWVEGFRK